jgi:hypothetical protein
MSPIPPPCAAWRTTLLAKYTTPLKGSQEDCSICLDPLKDNGITISRCKHGFHASCLATWCEQSSSCPFCRQQIFEKTHAKKEYVIPFISGPFVMSEAMYQSWTENEGWDAVRDFLPVVQRSVAWGHVAPEVSEEFEYVEDDEVEVIWVAGPPEGDFWF